MLLLPSQTIPWYFFSRKQQWKVKTAQEKFHIHPKNPGQESSAHPRGKQAEFLSQGQLQSFIPDLNSFIPSKKTRINLGLNPSGPRWGWNVTKFHISSFSCFPAPEKPEFWDQSSPSGAPTNEFLNPVEKLQLWSRNCSPPSAAKEFPVGFVCSSWKLDVLPSPGKLSLCHFQHGEIPISIFKQILILQNLKICFKLPSQSPFPPFFFSGILQENPCLFLYSSSFLS